MRSNSDLMLELTNVVSELTFLIGFMIVITLLIVLSELFAFLRWMSRHYIKRGDKMRKRTKKRHRIRRRDDSSLSLKASDKSSKIPAKENKFLRNRMASASVTSTPVAAVLDAAQRWPSEASAQILPSEEFDERSIREHLTKTVLKKTDLREMLLAARHNTLGDLLPPADGKSLLKAPPFVENIVVNPVNSFEPKASQTSAAVIQSSPMLVTSVEPMSPADSPLLKSAQEVSTPLNSSHSNRL